MNGASPSAFLPISTRFTSPRARTGSGVHYKCARRVNNPPGAYAIRHGQYAISYRQLPPPQPPPPPHELPPPPHELPPPLSELPPPPQEWWPPPWWPPPPPSEEPESPAHQLIPPPPSVATEPCERRRRCPRPLLRTTRTSATIAAKTSRMMKTPIVPTPVFRTFRCATVMPPPSATESKVEEVQRFPGTRRPLVCAGTRTRGQGWTTGPSRRRDLQRRRPKDTINGPPGSLATVGHQMRVHAKGHRRVGVSRPKPLRRPRASGSPGPCLESGARWG